jgi:hypothetical protein
MEALARRGAQVGRLKQRQTFGESGKETNPGRRPGRNATTNKKLHRPRYTHGPERPHRPVRAGRPDPPELWRKRLWGKAAPGNLVSAGASAASRRCERDDSWAAETGRSTTR